MYFESKKTGVYSPLTKVFQDGLCSLRLTVLANTLDMLNTYSGHYVQAIKNNMCLELHKIPIIPDGEKCI